MVSGFIIFLIALPLSLGIAIASGAPPLAGIFAAIVGGIVVSQISGSYVTINGPAAGLIVVILGAVDRLGGGDVGYHCALGAIVISGILLFIMGMLKAGSVPSGKDIRLDLSGMRLIDHTVMERLDHYAKEYMHAGGRFKIAGLDQHTTSSLHPLSARQLKK